MTIVLPSAAADVFWSPILSEQNRVLGMLDRDKNSRTFGSIDRVHWAWKFTDFPGARFQEGLCYLAFLYVTKHKENPLFENEPVLEWLQGGFANWSSIQGRGGDFDEAYPGERSLAATAFTSFYMSEAYLMLRSHLDDAARTQFEQSLTRAADWLCANDESHGFLSNHLAAAAAALLHASQILDHDKYAQRYQYFLRKILDHQSAEGWYEEYGGADPGYQTHGMFYLARCLELEENPELARSLDSASEFLSHFVHPDGSLGGEYASRNTQTYYPAAFEMLANRSVAAGSIAESARPSVTSGAAVGQRSVDAYNYFPLLNNYVFALRGVLARDARTEVRPLPDSPGLIHFPHAGLAKIRRGNFDLFVGYSKGGVIKLFDRNRRSLVFSSCGFIAVDTDGNQSSNQVFNIDAQADVTADEIRLTARFFGFSRPVMTPFKFLAFRVFSLTTGRFNAVAAWLKRLLVKVLIYRKNERELILDRRIRVSDDGISVEDTLSGAELSSMVTIQHRSVFSTIHMGSSRYFVPNELNVPSDIETVTFDSTDRIDHVSFVANVAVTGLED